MAGDASSSNVVEETNIPCTPQDEMLLCHRTFRHAKELYTSDLHVLAAGVVITDRKAFN